MPPVDKLIERLLRLRALYRDRGMIAAQSRSDCEARALVIYSDPVWADLLDSELGEPPKPAWLTYEAVGDADLARHLDGRPNVDVVVVGACVCSEQERVLHGLEEAARRGIPSILPADCAFPHLVHFSIPGIVLNWRDAIGTQGEFNYLLSGLLGGLQERKAWLHAQGRPCDHLPAAWSSAGA
jgi:hypothetical protein